MFDWVLKYGSAIHKMFYSKVALKSTRQGQVDVSRWYCLVICSTVGGSTQTVSEHQARLECIQLKKIKMTGSLSLSVSLSLSISPCLCLCLSPPCLPCLPCLLSSLSLYSCQHFRHPSGQTCLKSTVKTLWQILAQGVTSSIFTLPFEQVFVRWVPCLLSKFRVLRLLLTTNSEIAS